MEELVLNLMKRGAVTSFDIVQFMSGLNIGKFEQVLKMRDE